MRVLAFDLGGTRLKAGLVEGGRVVARATAPTSGLDARAALRLVVNEGRALARASVDVVGLAVPGLVSRSRVVSLHGKLAGISQAEPAEVLRDAFAAPALVENDARAYGVGEVRSQPQLAALRVVVITIGTGVGVSVIERGLPLGDGVTGGGILGGMIPIDPSDEHADGAGLRGTIEAQCRAAALVELARREGSSAQSTEEVYATAASEHGAQTRVALDRYRARLARAVAALVHAHGPDAVVLGGGPLYAGAPVFEGLDAEVRRLLWPGLTVDLRPARAGDDAALLGLAHFCERT